MIKNNYAYEAINYQHRNPIERSDTCTYCTINIQLDKESYKYFGFSEFNFLALKIMPILQFIHSSNLK